MEERDNLLKELSIYYEQSQQMPPLAAKIYSKLIICPKPGHTFEEILDYSGASKSSVSTNINLLLDRGNVEFFTKEGERRRYFRLSKNYLELTLKNRQDVVHRELEIFQKIHTYGKEVLGDTEENKRREKFRELYMIYLSNQIENIETYRDKMNELFKTKEQ